MRTQKLLLPGLLAGSLLLTACGGGGDAFEEADPGATAGGGGGGSLTVGGAQFTEMSVMQSMYALLLEEAGYTVDTQTAEQREIYAPALVSGEMDVVPEYAATFVQYLNRQANGPDAEEITSSDVDATIEAGQPLLEEQGLAFLEPAEAADTNGFYVTQAFAEENGLETLTDLGELGQPVTIAAGDECLDRPFCAPGLEETYGLDVAGVTGDSFASITGKQKVVDGSAQLGLTGTTDGTLEGLGLVILEDDQGLQAADNLVPVVNEETAGDPGVAEALNALAPVLTTEDLTQLNLQVDEQRLLPEDVARDYLVEQGLIEG
ncbi:ABC transporter substrate-binding protein [uncultured Pseudokineococcus sp.]|uniref:ABC transporter substrate-binding protein n=1 Tax=uncultured Pseudokineococcus sp. TaxID=1642928 RepID=UPI00261D2F9C|nr:ABC transporter substrate-binding protein [uncultured Pseudokineococcus sp.]